MFDRRHVLALVAVVLPLCAAAQRTGVAPQSRADHSALLVDYKKRLAAANEIIARDEARVAVELASGAKRYAAPVSRLGLTILTSDSMRSYATEMLRVADSLARLTPYAIPPGLKVTLRLMPRLPRFAFDTVVFWSFSDAEHPERSRFSSWRDSVPLMLAAKQLAEIYTNSTGGALPSALQAWAPKQFGPTESPSRWETAYTQLVVSPATVNRACLEGVITACRQVLRIDVPRDALTEWYTPGFRYSIVAPLISPENRTQLRRNVETRMPQALAACTQERDDVACTQIIRSQYDSGSYMVPTIGDEPTELLIDAAVTMPGAPGLPAIVGKNQLSLVASIEAMSGHTLDQVVTAWIRRLQAARPEAMELPAPRVMSATMWIVIIGALAIGGSRWRSA